MAKDEQRAGALKQEGDALYSKGHYSEAEAKYKEATNADHNLKEAWFNLGLTYKKLHELDKAVVAFRLALSCDPDYSKANLHYATCLEQQGKLQEAFVVLINFAQSHPENSTNQRALQSLQQRHGAFASYIVVDLKLQEDGRIIILELGEGAKSSVDGLDKLRGKKNYELTLLQAEMRTHPRFYFLPIHDDTEKELWEKQSQMLGDLPKESPRVPNDFTRLDAYTAIFGTGIQKPRAYGYPKLPPQCLTMGHADEAHALQFKTMTHERFVQAQLSAYRPASVIVDKLGGITPSANKMKEEQMQALMIKAAKRNVQVILKAMPSVNNFVIKLASIEGGRGVFLVAKNQLGPYLMLLATSAFSLELNYYKKELIKLHCSNAAADRLAYTLSTSDDQKLLVEEYIPGKPVMVKGKLYDATMRALCLITRDQGKMQCKVMDVYCKLPPNAIAEGQLSYETTVSSFNKSDKHLNIQTLKGTSRN